MEELILSALSGHNIIEFTYDGRIRVCEAHVLGVANGVKQVLCYQLSGGSKRGKIPNWRRFDLGSIQNLEVKEQTHDGQRPIPSGAHSLWDKILVVVS
jgi:hypothetical protein